jgi:lipopolysaccharide export system protein LptC
MPKFSFLILPATLAIAVYFVISSFESNDTTATQSLVSFPTEIQSVSEGIRTISYDEQGEIAYTLQAESQVHHNDDSSELEKPVIRLFRNNSPRWNIVANSGNISAQLEGQSENSRQLALSGNVQLVNLDEFGNRITLDTEYLMIMPEIEVAETDRRVFLSTTNIEQTALGMIARFGSDEITFLSNSEGRYVPAPEE